MKRKNFSKLILHQGIYKGKRPLGYPKTAGYFSFCWEGTTNE